MNQASKDITKTAFSLAYDSATRFDEKVKSTFARYKSEKEKAKERATPGIFGHAQKYGNSSTA